MKLRKILVDVTGYPQNHKEDDHEVSMAVTDLKSLAHRAAKLAKFIEESDQTELKGWIQSKITKSADYINAVYEEYMFGDEGCSSCDHDDDDDDDREDLDEAKSTCCGRCGRFHVKGTSCPKPFLTGKRHCRNRPR